MTPRPIELVLVWHHHQPDYRRPHDGCAMLPWVRLHAAKDYLDMAQRLERFPGMRCTFNFVPSLLDQLDDAARGGPDDLFDRLATPLGERSREDRERLLARCAQAPRHAFDRWPAYRTLAERARRASRSETTPGLSDREIVRLETWFLLAWIDPTLYADPAVRAVLEVAPSFEPEHRDALIAFVTDVCGRVVPAYRRCARRGQIELAISPYNHPILPLLVDVRAAQRARPDLPLPHEPFTAPDDAERQIVRAHARGEKAFGVPLPGMWPPEGSVSPEAVAIARGAGVRWLASDEGVLWRSLESRERRGDALYTPWRFDTDAGPMAIFFRDHELSDRIGFVYQNWAAEDAVADFLERVRRAGRERTGTGPCVVSVILDGDNCWESYPEDGGPFLDRLYAAIEAAPDIVPRTPSEYLDRLEELPVLERLHSGSWIDADFHIWVGHAEKNRAWEQVARARRALVDRGLTPESAPEAWEALFRAEGSDWFWWFGDDHFTADKSLFDQLFRSHVRAVFERAGLPVPSSLDIAIAGSSSRNLRERTPVGFIRPVIDGRRTGFYEWHGAGRYRHGPGSAMHHGPTLVEEVQFGFDAEHLYLRLDFANGRRPELRDALLLEMVAPRSAAITVTGLGGPTPAVRWSAGGRVGEPVPHARAALEAIFELSVPFASLGVAAGDALELVGRIERDGEPVEGVPQDDMIRFRVPSPADAARAWSA